MPARSCISFSWFYYFADDWEYMPYFDIWLRLGLGNSLHVCRLYGALSCHASKSPLLYCFRLPLVSYKYAQEEHYKMSWFTISLYNIFILSFSLVAFWPSVSWAATVRLAAHAEHKHLHCHFLDDTFSQLVIRQLRALTHSKVYIIIFDSRWPLTSACRATYR